MLDSVATRWVMVLCMAGASSTGCDGDARAVELVDVGRACLVAEEGATPERLQQFSAGQPVFVHYLLDDVCLSSSCTADRLASCTIVTDGVVHAVTSRFQWVEATRADRACTDDCRMLSATCATDGLPAGTYEFRLGDAAPVALTIPSVLDTAPCQRVPAP